MVCSAACLAWPWGLVGKWVVLVLPCWGAAWTARVVCGGVVDRLGGTV